MVLQRPVVRAVVLALLLLLSALVTASLVGQDPVGTLAAGLPGSAGSPVREVVAPAFEAEGSTPYLGVMPASAPLTVLVGLTPAAGNDWNATLALEYTPGSSQFRHYISADQFEATYAPSATTYEEAERYFAAFGLNVIPSPDRMILEVSGPSSEVGAAFDTQFERFGTATSWFYSHLTAASLPASLGLRSVLGLGNETPIQPSVPSSFVMVNPSPRSTTAAGGSCPAPGGAFLPCQIQDGYNETPFLQNGTNGTGTRIGIVDRYDGSEPQSRLASDLASFEASYGLAGAPVSYLYPVPTSRDLNSTFDNWGVEEALDLEWARAAAPGASIDMTFSPDASVGLYVAVDWLVAHQAVNVISLSWGEPDVGIFNESACGDSCNATSDGSYALLHPVLMEAALEGISVFAASGDCGAAAGTNGVSTNFPASDPWVTGVGGTVLALSSHDRYGSETGWGGNVSGAERCNNQGGSGGGFSPFPRPAWQSGPGLPAAPQTRGVPDVALDAGSPVVIFEGGQSVAVRGTSVATPIWAGFAAVADNASHGPLGFLDPSLYGILRSSNYSRAFHDVTSGWNGYYAGTGWDPVTGIGTPNLSVLVPRLATPTLAPANFTVELLANPRSGAAPLKTSFNVSIQGGSGVFPLVDVSFGDGSASIAATGRVNHTYTQPGVYSAQAVVFDARGNSSFSPLTAIVVGGGSALNVTLASSVTKASVGSSVTFNASTLGGVAPLRFDYAFGDGTYLNDSNRSSVPHTYGAAGGYCASVVVADSGVPSSGGTSNRVPETIGKASPPACTPWVQLRASLTSPFVAADLPGNFPLHVSVVGGTGPVEVQYVSDDPYASACHCSIFRTAGTHSIVAFVNDSLNQEVRAQLNFTLYPALNATFTTSGLSGPAPFSVGLFVTATGGHAVNTSRTSWLFGDGTHAVGDSVDHLFTQPGFYRIQGSLADGGGGNVSEAFLVDVYGQNGSAGLVLTASLDPAVRVAGGTTVHALAQVTGGTAPYAILWSFGTFATGFGNEINESLPDSGCLAANTCPFDVNLTATDAHGKSVEAALQLSPAEAGEVSALNWTDRVGPTNGSAPLIFNGTVTANGVPDWSVAWTFGDGGTAAGTSVQHAYLTPGNYTETETASDPWGDVLVRTHAVRVSGSAVSPLTVSGGPSGTGGPVPWTVQFSVAVAGGGGGPYSFRWDFGDHNNSTQQNPTHTYQHAGNYNATVVVTNGLGVSARESYALLAYDRVPVEVHVTVPNPVLAGDSVPVRLSAVVHCPVFAPTGCNVSQVSVSATFGGDNGAGPTLGSFGPSGTLALNLTAPTALGTTTLTVTVIGPNYEGSAQTAVQVELITLVPALVIGGVVAAAVASVAWVIVRRRRSAIP